MLAASYSLPTLAVQQLESLPKLQLRAAHNFETWSLAPVDILSAVHENGVGCLLYVQGCPSAEVLLI